MKTYRYKHNEILIPDSILAEDSFMAACNELFDGLLLSKNISNQKIYQSFNLHNNKITSTPHIVKALLMSRYLPAFRFLICQN